jgi:hypothetical protein
MGNIRVTCCVLSLVVGLDCIPTFGASKLEIALGTFQVQRLGEFPYRNGKVNVNQAFCHGRFSQSLPPLRFGVIGYFGKGSSACVTKCRTESSKWSLCPAPHRAESSNCQFLGMAFGLQVPVSVPCIVWIIFVASQLSPSHSISRETKRHSPRSNTLGLVAITCSWIS